MNGFVAEEAPSKLGASRVDEPVPCHGGDEAGLVSGCDGWAKGLWFNDCRDCEAGTAVGCGELRELDIPGETEHTQ